MLRVRQTTVSKIVNENNIQKNRRIIKKIVDFIYSTIDKDNIGLKRKYEKYKLITKSLIEIEKSIEYIKNNIHKSKRELSVDLNMSLFKINKMINEM